MLPPRPLPEPTRAEQVAWGLRYWQACYGSSWEAWVPRRGTFAVDTFCVVCQELHPPPVAVALGDRCPRSERWVAAARMCPWDSDGDGDCPRCVGVGCLVKRLRLFAAATHDAADRCRAVGMLPTAEKLDAAAASCDWQAAKVAKRFGEPDPKGKP